MSSSTEPLQTATGGGLPEGATWALNLLARPWTPHLLLLLAQRPTRYRDLHTALPAMSTAVLTGRLRTLTDAGLVCRRLVDGDPGVHYEATAVGAALARPLANLAATAATLYGVAR